MTAKIPLTNNLSPALIEAAKRYLHGLYHTSDSQTKTHIIMRFIQEGWAKDGKEALEYLEHELDR